MPYIPITSRPRARFSPMTPGELNFAITSLVLWYLEHATLGNYAAMNEVVGALELAKAEFIRRAVSPYEDGKIAEHGDVYPEVTLD